MYADSKSGSNNSHVAKYQNFVNPIWRPAAILKIVFWVYLNDLVKLRRLTQTQNFRIRTSLTSRAEIESQSRCSTVVPPALLASSCDVDVHRYYYLFKFIVYSLLVACRRWRLDVQTNYFADFVSFIFVTNIYVISFTYIQGGPN